MLSFSESKYFLPGYQLGSNLCGYELPGEFVIPPGTHSEIRIQFRSSFSQNFEGFAVNVTFSPHEEAIPGNGSSGEL